MPTRPERPRTIPHPVLTAEADREKARIAANDADLATRQAFFRVTALLAGAWEAADGILFVWSGPDRLKAQVFIWPAKHIPLWPWPVAVVIALAGVDQGHAGWRAVPHVGGIALLVISAWHFAYWLLLWYAIDTRPPPGLKPTSLPPISDHGYISATACVWGLMLLRIWWRRGRPSRLDHAA